MEQWCEDPTKDTNYHLYVFLSFSIASSVFMLFRAYTLVIGGIKLGSTTHKKIIKALLYTSLNDFYNRVPTGRIINRLTKDMREVDESIGYAVGNFYVSLFSLLGNLIICLYASTYLMLIPMIIVTYISNRLRQYYMKTQR
jgi:ATP-binding cassette subfamily C (CFTR/MRP) protein 1